MACREKISKIENQCIYTDRKRFVGFLKRQRKISNDRGVLYIKVALV